VWTVPIEVVFILTQHGSGMVFVVDQDPVAALGSDAADEAFGERVRSRCPSWSLDHMDALRREDRVERSAELRVPVPDEKPERCGSLAEVHDRVACLLGGPRRRRVGGHAEYVDATAGDLHDEQHVKPARGDRVDVEEISGQQSGRLRSQTPAPGRVIPEGDFMALAGLPTGG
jgi:hypothetical protein